LGADDDETCVEHVWQFRSVEFRDDGSWSEYGCPRCDGQLLVPPGGQHPETV
jgi:hypothetical protein